VASSDEVRNAAPKAKVLNRERVRFEAAGANHHLVAAFDFQRQIAFVKFIGARRTYMTEARDRDNCAAVAEGTRQSSG
jgi:mRNA-degrading endonuclease HigB of HigAB toxin-antitoxin module